MKAVVIYSGGMDSTVLLNLLLSEGHEVKALSVDYGQRHRRELDMAKEQARLAGVDHVIADLSGVRPLLASSALTSRSVEVPSGYYTDESMKATVVPNRNMLMLSLGAAWAMTLGFDAVAYGAHSGDHAIYHDCREEFAEACARTIALADPREVKLIRPFVHMNKEEICRLGVKLGVRFDLTWSCYRGGEYHCGTCGTCVERREAFKMAGVEDPTIYEDAIPLSERAV